MVSNDFEDFETFCHLLDHSCVLFFYIFRFFYSTSASKCKLPDTFVPGEKLCLSNGQTYFKTSFFDPQKSKLSAASELLT